MNHLVKKFVKSKHIMACNGYVQQAAWMEIADFAASIGPYSGLQLSKQNVPIA